METARFYLIRTVRCDFDELAEARFGPRMPWHVASTLYVIGSGQDSGTLSILDLDKYVAGDDGERGDFLCPASAQAEAQGS
jgi:hypothetical protein